MYGDEVMVGVAEVLGFTKGVLIDIAPVCLQAIA